MKRVLFFIALMLPLTTLAQQVEKLQKRVSKGDTKAMRELAAHYEAGYGLPVDTAKALELYRRADGLGDADAKGDLSRLAIYYSALGYDSTECYRLAKASADAGSAYGTYRLAVCYHDGFGVAKDAQRFRELNEKAIGMGCEEALALKARLLLFGCTPYPHDVPQAFQCLKKLKAGSCHAMKYGLLSAYYRMVDDEAMALKSLRQAVAFGEPMGELEMADCQYFGYGVPMDERAALAEYERLLDKFHGNAQVKICLARLLSGASDTTLRDNDRALRLLLEVGDEHGVSNYDMVAVSYIFGSFTPIDTAAAYRYWLRGARKGDLASIDNLVRYFDIIGNSDSADYYCQMGYELESTNSAARLADRAVEREDYDAAQRYALQGADWGEEELRVSAGRLYLALSEFDKARECFEKATANGNNGAYVYRSMVASQVDGNTKKAVKLLEEGGRKGSSTCWVTLGKYYESAEKPDFRKAADCYRKAADSRDNSAAPQADYQLGRLYLNGMLDKGEEPSDESIDSGIRLLRRSAEAGNRDGRYWLGYSYQQGIGCERNLDSALHYFSQLADEGDGLANMQMAIAYEHGRGVEADTAVAMRYYRQAGENGVSDGYAYLGDFYRNGTSTIAADSARAFEYYTLAADIDDDNAAGLYYVGDSYMRGIGVQRDTAAALPYFQRAAAQGSYTSMGVLGDYYNYGWAGVSQQGDSALHYYFEASKGDDPRGDYMIGAWLQDQEVYDKAVEYYASAAGNGNIDAYVALAVAAMGGHVPDWTQADAVGVLENVASRNSSGRAYRILSVARLNGIGCPADTALALRYLDSAIAFGSADAMMTLGNYYAGGEVVPQDTVKTLELYNRAVAAGSVTAMKRLAASHQQGAVVPLDKKRAAELYQMAADRGDLEGICRLGLCYEEGEGVILNSRKAYNLYMQAAERGSAYGMYLVAMCYTEGIFVKEDMEQAAQWFLKGAEAGSVQCCYFIGQLYAKGEGVKKDKKEAKRWLTIAAENGMEAAEQALREL